MITYDLDKLNSATSYPSIPTYHAMNERGQLIEEVQVDFGNEPVHVTEKIDGTNARILVDPEGDWIIGSRKELLAAKGDRIVNPAQGVVATLRRVTDRLRLPLSGLDVHYLEVYGGRVNAWKNYTAGQQSAARLFDVAVFADELLEELMTRDVAAIAAWRDHGNQKFLAKDYVYSDLPRVPFVSQSAPPKSLPETLEWLKATVKQTHCAIEVGDHPGKAEGVVVSTLDRQKIAKIRYEDYERLLRRKA